MHEHFTLYGQSFFTECDGHKHVSDFYIDGYTYWDAKRDALVYAYGDVHRDTAAASGQVGALRDSVDGHL